MSLTLDKFREAIQVMYNDQDPEPREFVAITGIGGMKMINKAMQEEVWRQRKADAHKTVHALNNNGKITIEEWANLKHMIDSPDHENLIVVESILEHYENT
jgi:hypothetical protein